MSHVQGLSLPKAELIALCLESMIFGVHSVLYALATWILLFRKKTQNNPVLCKVLYATSTLMWMLVVAHLCLDMRRAITGFVDEENGATAYFLRLNDPTHVAKSAIFKTSTLLGDSFVTYRLYVVWNRKWSIVVLPVLLIIATAITGYGACWQFAHAHSDVPIFHANLMPWIASFFSLSLATNLLTTFLITARIMWSFRKVWRHYAGSNPTWRWNVVETIVQSAAIYSAALASLLGTYAAGSNAQYICLDALQPLIGVVFTLIIIRVGLGDEESLSDARNPDDRRASAATTRRSSCHEYPGRRTVAINVSVLRTCERGSIQLNSPKDLAVNVV